MHTCCVNFGNGKACARLVVSKTSEDNLFTAVVALRFGFAVTAEAASRTLSIRRGTQAADARTGRQQFHHQQQPCVRLEREFQKSAP